MASTLRPFVLMGRLWAPMMLTTVEACNATEHAVDRGCCEAEARVVLNVRVPDTNIDVLVIDARSCTKACVRAT